MSKDTNKKIVSIEIPKTLYEKLKYLSLLEDRSFSSYVRRILEAYADAINSDTLDH